MWADQRSRTSVYAELGACNRSQQLLGTSSCLRRLRQHDPLPYEWIARSWSSIMTYHTIIDDLGYNYGLRLLHYGSVVYKHDRRHYHPP